MNGKFLIAALGAAVVVFIGGWVIYGMILMNYMAAHSFMKGQPAMWGIAVGNLFSGLLYAYVCQLAGAKSFGKGLTTGAILGGLMALSTNFIGLGADMFDSLTPMLIDTLAKVILTGLGCGIAGALMKGSNATQGSR